MKTFALTHRVIGSLILAVLLVLRADASTRETYNLPAIANLSLAAGAAPTSVVFGRLDGMPASCPVKLAIAIKGEVEANGSTAGFYDEVVLRVGGKEYAAFAGDAWSGPGNWSLSDPYRGKIKSRTFEVEVKPGEEIVLEYLTRNQHWNEGWAQIQSVKLLDGGCAGGNCGGGGGGVGNQCVSLEISLGSQISSDDSAGWLRLKVEQPTATAYTPAALELVTGLYNRTAAEEALASALTPPMVVINAAGELWETGELLRQVLSPTILADIVPVSETKFEVRIYPRGRVTGRGSTGLFEVSGAMGDTLFLWTVENPAPSSIPANQRVLITKQSECLNEAYAFEWIAAAQDWILTRGAGSVAITERRTKESPAAGITVERLEILNHLAAVVHEESETWASTNFGERLLARTVGGGAHLKTTSYDYWPADSGSNRDGRLKRQTGPDGRWEYFHDYDAQGNVTKKVEQFLNHPFSGTWPDNLNRMIDVQRSTSGQSFEERFDASLGDFVTYSSQVPNWAHRLLTTEAHAAIEVSGAVSQPTVDAWLISPPLDLTGSDQVSVRFRTDIDNGSADGFTREVYLLKNYAGSGFPLVNGAEVVNITELCGAALDATSAFTSTPLIDITAEVVPGVRLAFRYQGKGRRWKIDDVAVSLRRQIEEATTVSLAGQVVAKSWLRDTTPSDLRTITEAIEGRAVTIAVATDLSATALESAGNRVTRRDYYPKDAVSPGLPHQLKRTLNPDGTISLFEYEMTGAGGLITKEWSGESDAENTAVTHGYLSTREENAQGHIIATSRYYLKAGDDDLLMESMDAVELDAQNRPTKFVFGDGSTLERTYNCSGVKSETDREGIRSENKYDDHGRLYRTERWHGPELESYVRYELDAAGRQTKEFRWGRDAGSEQLVRERSYLTNGELAWEIDVLNRQVNYDESIDPVSGLITHTQTLPGSSTLIARTASHYPDGSLHEIAGLAVQPVRHLPTVEEHPAHAGQYLAVDTAAVLDAAGNVPVNAGVLTGEFVSKASGPGGAYAFERRPAADGNGAVLTQTWSDAAGRVLKRAHADGRTELAAHTIFASVNALDVDGDGQIGLDGSDTVRRTSRTFLSAHGTTVQRDTLEERTDANVWQLVAQTDTELLDLNENGLETWTTNYSSTVSTRETIDRGSRTRQVVTTLPDQSRRVADYSNGRLVAEYALSASGNSPERTVALTYDGLGRLTKSSDSIDGDSDYEYHADDRLAKITTPDPDPTQSGPGFDRQVVTITYTLEESGDELTTTTLPGAVVQKRLTNPRGQVIKQWGYGVNPQELAYTTAGRVETLTTWKEFNQATGTGTAGSATTIWRYNPAGLLEQVFYNYQGENLQAPGQLLADPGVRYDYTPGGLLRKRTAARTNSQSQPLEAIYNYDDGEIGEARSLRLLGISYLNHETASADVGYSYFRNGQIERVTDSSGTRRHEFNEGLLTKVAYESGPLAGLEVGRSHNYATGRTITHITAGVAEATPFHTVDFGYTDDYGRLKSLTASGTVMTYTYRSDTTDAQSLTYGSISDPGYVQEWQRDLLRRVHTVRSTRGAGAGQQLYHQTLRRYDDLNRTTRDTHQDGTYWNYGYDALGQVSSAQKLRSNAAAFPGHQFGYTHDAIGNRTATEVNSRTAAYTANLLNKYEQRAVPGAIDVRGAAPTHLKILINDEILARAQGAGAPEDFFQAVPVDNSTSAVARHLRVQAVDTATTPPEVATERRAVFVPQTPEVFMHDADGNLTEDGRWHYTWDAENRLVAMETRTATVVAGAPREKLEFIYDDQARRVSKRCYAWNAALAEWDLQSLRLFLWDGWTLLAELTVSDFGERVPAAAYVWGREQIEGAGDGARQLALVRQFTGGAPGDYAPTYGHNYSVVGYVNTATGEHSASYEYGAFGESVSVSGPQARDFSFRFSTKYADAETGLSYFGYRYYSPNTGRWLSRDPIGEFGGSNLFSYVRNASVNIFDSLGLYAPHVHYAASFMAAVNSGYSIHEAHKIASASVSIDFRGTQGKDSGSTAIHAMAGENLHTGKVQSADEARKCHEDYINLQLRLAAMARATREGAAEKTAFYQGLGFALHAKQDSLAPGHAGYQKWEGSGNLAELVKHIFGDFFVNRYEFAALVGTSQQMLVEFETSGRP